MILEYKKDENGHDILISSQGEHQVMMEWEKPYMEQCIDKLNPYGDVLEIGFGFGYSASRICSYSNVKSYTVIECCPTVWEKFEEWKIAFPNVDIKLVKGRWEDMLCTLGKFDCVFFDDYCHSPMDKDRIHNFMHLILKLNTKIGTKISAYSNFSVSSDDSNDFVDIECYEMIIDKPKNCNYTRGNKMYIPIITVKKQVTNEDEYILKKNLYSQKEKIIGYLNDKKRYRIQTIVIDNFLDNVDEVKKHYLSEPIKNNTSEKNYINDTIKDKIENILNVKITNWNSSDNGLFYLRDNRTPFEIKININSKKWIGILFLDSNIIRKSGISFYRFTDGTTYPSESIVKNNYSIIKDCSKDTTLWQKTETICNVPNRLVLFDADTFYSLENPYGNNKNTCQLVQVFKF